MNTVVKVLLFVILFLGLVFITNLLAIMSNVNSIILFTLLSAYAVYIGVPLFYTDIYVIKNPNVVFYSSITASLVFIALVLTINRQQDPTPIIEPRHQVKKIVN